MFSRIYKSARALLTDPQVPSPQTPPKSKNSPGMVTSRSRSRAARGEVETNDASSSGKKRRLRSSIGTEDTEEAEVATPTAAKKRKTLPLREKTATPMVKSSIPVVEIPARRVTPEKENVLGMPTKPIEIEDDVEESSEEDGSEGEDLGEEEEEKVEELQKAEVDTTTKHKRFDSEEAEPEVLSTAQEVPSTAGEVADSEEDSDSEDDAPEAIGIQEAAKEVKSKERDTAKAVKE